MDAQKLMFVYEKVHQLLPPRPPTGALPLDPHFSKGSAASDVFSKKGTCGVQWGLEKIPTEAGEFSNIFVLKVTLQSVRLLLTVCYRKNGGTGCTSCSPNNSRCSPSSRAYQSINQVIFIVA